LLLENFIFLFLIIQLKNAGRLASCASSFYRLHPTHQGCQPCTLGYFEAQPVTTLDVVECKYPNLVLKKLFNFKMVGTKPITQLFVNFIWYNIVRAPNNAE
jgi:hypothetical protein